MDLQSIGKMSALTNDLTPIQIGTTGMFSNEKFEVIGRMKVGYFDGFWNEWYTMGGGDKEGWLVEAQGFFAHCYPFAEKEMPSQHIIKPGKVVDFGTLGYFEVEDIREVQCFYSEGELPVNAMKGRASMSVDLTGFEDMMATIEYAEKETRVFQGAYQEFDDFQFKNLRHIDGW